VGFRVLLPAVDEQLRHGELCAVFYERGTSVYNAVPLAAQEALSVSLVIHICTCELCPVTS